MSVVNSNLPVGAGDLAAKSRALAEHLHSLGRLLVAYSGGVDSGFLAWAAHRELGDDMLAVLADSPSLARSQMRDAVAFADEQGIPLSVIATEEMERPEYLRNDGARCYHCKDELFTVMEEHRQRLGFDTIAYGVNLDDQGDFRPGQQAAREHHVAAPLLAAGLTKADIRQLARKRDCVSGTNLPRRACLRGSSTVAQSPGKRYRRWSKAKMRCENLVSARCGCVITARSRGIEIAREELPRAMTMEMAAEFTRIFKALGFTYVTLDLEGFRSGSMNALLPVGALLKIVAKD